MWLWLVAVEMGCFLVVVGGDAVKDGGGDVLDRISIFIFFIIHFQSERGTSDMHAFLSE